MKTNANKKFILIGAVVLVFSASVGLNIYSQTASTAIVALEDIDLSSTNNDSNIMPLALTATGRKELTNVSVLNDINSILGQHKVVHLKV